MSGKLLWVLLPVVALAGCEMGASARRESAATTEPRALVTPAGPVLTLTGIPEVTDGDTLRFGDLRVRLAGGVDAFERGQTCGELACGELARAEMVRLVAGRTVTCAGDGEADRYRRPVVHCWTADGRDLGAAMVQSGWAVAEERWGTEYVHLEAQAKVAERGVWAGTFQRPAQWRGRKRSKR